MEYLTGQFRGVNVEATIFGAPGAAENKHMRDLLLRPGVSFCPVPRGERQAGEPTDEAIIARLQTYARSSCRERVGLLTADTGFAPVMSQLMSDKHQLFALIPSRRVFTANIYKEHGVPVLTLPGEARLSKVKAILNPDGTGRVELGEEFDPAPHYAEVDRMYKSWEELLKGQRCQRAFSSSPGFAIQKIVKFWYANGLGSLPVYPSMLATLALDRAIQQGSERWISNTDSLAYILPTASLVKTKSGLETYGTVRARSIFGGGGPIVLQDSSDLVDQALRKLGYLDDSWNTDFAEALDCFWNNSPNKHQLRKMGILIDTLDTTSGAAGKLRMALLSDSSSGQWHLGGTCTPAVVQLLQGKKLLSGDCEVPAMDDVWQAMQTYAAVHRLPKMRNFNGQADQIIQHCNQSHPQRRSRIAIE
eukprot:Skav218319  [mRNA]  locus=scaffold2239:101002:102258:+ [translate_table: standard]